MLEKFLPFLALLLAISLWSFAYIASKFALMAFDPVFLVFCRMLLGTVIFLPAAKYFLRVRPTRKELLLLVSMSICEPCASFLFEALALSRTSVSQAGMIAAMLPIMVALAAVIFLKEKIKTRAWVGTGLALLGVLWLSAGACPSEQAPNPILGNFLEFLSMSMAVVNIIMAKRLIVKFSPLFLVVFQTAFGAVFYFPALFLPQVTLPQALPLVPTLGLIYLGTFVTIGAYFLYNFSMVRLPASQASAFINLLPVMALVFARIFLGESFTPEQYAASALVICGLFLARQPEERPSSAGPAPSI